MAYGVESDLRGMYAAFPNKIGALSVLMAQKGITGPRNSLEGKGGFFQVFADGKYDRATFTDGLGEKFRAGEVSFKPWPCCGRNHLYIEATLAIVSKHDLKPEDIAEITVHITTKVARNLCEPLEGRRKPATCMDAKYSIPFVVSTAVVKRAVGIDDFTLEGIRNPAVLEVARRVTPRYDLPAVDPLGFAPVTVWIKTRDGREYSQRAEIAYGHPGNPMTVESLCAKFRDCAAYSANPLPAKNVEKAVRMLTDLENVNDVSEIPRLLGRKMRG